MTRSKNAFTLIELLLVLAIVGILAGILGASLGSGLASDRLALAAGDLAVSLRLAADRAALTGLRQRVVLAWEPASMRVEEEAEGLDKPEEWTIPTLEWAKKRDLASPVRWKSVTTDPDQELLRKEIVAGEGAATEVAIAYDPDRHHSFVEIGGEGGGPLEGTVIEVRVVAGDDPPLVVRLEASGRIRTLTESALEEEKKAASEAARTKGSGS